MCNSNVPDVLKICLHAIAVPAYDICLLCLLGLITFTNTSQSESQSFCSVNIAIVQFIILLGQAPILACVTEVSRVSHAYVETMFLPYQCINSPNIVCAINYVKENL